MYRYFVTGKVNKIGPVQHIIKAQNAKLAWAKFVAAHATRDPVFIKSERKGEALARDGGQ